jgi:hypothetical protein
MFLHSVDYFRGGVDIFTVTCDDKIVVPRGDLHIHLFTQKFQM